MWLLAIELKDNIYDNMDCSSFCIKPWSLGPEGDVCTLTIVPNFFDGAKIIYKKIVQPSNSTFGLLLLSVFLGQKVITIERQFLFEFYIHVDFFRSNAITSMCSILWHYTRLFVIANDRDRDCYRRNRLNRIDRVLHVQICKQCWCFALSFN